MKVRVKICGIRTIQSAQVAVDAGADFLGFNFVPSSKRFINPLDAKRIITQIKGRVKTVGVFQNAEKEYVNNIVINLKLDFAQLHGNESPSFITHIKASVIKAIHLSQTIDINQLITDMQNYKVDYFLIDRERQGKGDGVDTEKARVISQRFPLFLAGGLTIHNVEKMIESVRPYAVDVASGIETDGTPDIKKIIHFIHKSKGVHI